MRSLSQIFGPFLHLMPLEVVIWERWLAGEGAAYAPYRYDVRVGEGLQMGTGANELERHIAHIETQKRIDAVSETQEEKNIWEVKSRAGLGAIGQLLGYGSLYRSTYNYSGEMKLWLITDRLQPDLPPLLREAGITYREV